MEVSTMFTYQIQSREKFYPTYNEWCEAHGFPTIPSSWLPEKVFIAYKDDIPTHSCFFWETDSALALIGFPCSNKLADKEVKEGGLEYLYAVMCEYAKSKHYQSISTYSHSERPTILSALKANNFVIGDVDVINLIKHL